MEHLSWVHQRYLSIVLILGALLLGFTESGKAQLILDGPEFQVNTYTSGSQNYQDMTMSDNGTALVVWSSTAGQDGDWSGVFAQRYDMTGAPLGPEFQVNTFTSSSQDYPDTAMDANGNAMVVWRSNFQDGSNRGVFGQRYDDTGTPDGPEFQVNTYTLGWQGSPSVAMDASGNAVVVWISEDQDGDNWGIFGQRYDSTGAPVGGEFQVNSYTTNEQTNPVVAMNPSGNFVVVWQSLGQDGDFHGVYGQRYDNTGAPWGLEFQVNTHTSNDQIGPAVDMDADGNVVVVWNDLSGQDGDTIGVFGQRFDATGSPIGGEFQVNTYTTSVQGSPSVAMDDSGNFVIAWNSSDSQDGDHLGIFGQHYDANGTTIGPEFQVNTYTMGEQSTPTVSMDSSGNAMVVWRSVDQDGDSHGIFGQRYFTNTAPNCGQATPSPAALFSNDHAFKIIDIQGVSDADGDALTITVDYIYQDEQLLGLGSGNTAPDGQGIGSNGAEVRDEHNVFGNGRTYRINFTAEDGLGGSCSGMVFVRASPKSKFDWDWVVFDSTVIPPPEINGLKTR